MLPAGQAIEPPRMNSNCLLVPRNEKGARDFSRAPLTLLTRPRLRRKAHTPPNRAICAFLEAPVDGRSRHDPGDFYKPIS